MKEDDKKIRQEFESNYYGKKKKEKLAQYSADEMQDKDKSEADKWLSQNSNKGAKKEEEQSEYEGLKEKDGTYTPEFGDYKKMFSKHQPPEGKNWYHYRDSKNKYLGSVLGSNEEEALSHSDKFKNADHVLKHGDVIGNKTRPAPTIEEIRKEKGESPEVKEKEAPKDIDYDKMLQDIDDGKKALSKPEAEIKKPEEVQLDVPKESTPEAPNLTQEAPKTESEPITPTEDSGSTERPRKTVMIGNKNNNIEGIISRNKPLIEDSPENAFESMVQKHTRLFHRIAHGLKNSKRIPFSMEDDKIEDSGRKAMAHAVAHFDEDKAKNFFEHSQEKASGKDYSPDLAFHVWLKSQIEHHLLDAAHKQLDLPVSAKRILTQQKFEGAPKEYKESAKDGSEGIAEQEASSTKPPTEENKIQNTGTPKENVPKVEAKIPTPIAETKKQEPEIKHIENTVPQTPSPNPTPVVESSEPKVEGAEKPVTNKGKRRDFSGLA